MFRTILKTLSTIIFIAIQAINTPATAQNGAQIELNSSIKNVLTTERVRAELLAHAPQGVTASNGRQNHAKHGLGGFAAGASAQMAHLLEEFWRFWLAHAADRGRCPWA